MKNFSMRIAAALVAAGAGVALAAGPASATEQPAEVGVSTQGPAINDNMPAHVQEALLQLRLDRGWQQPVVEEPVDEAPGGGFTTLGHSWT